MKSVRKEPSWTSTYCIWAGIFCLTSLTMDKPSVVLRKANPSPQGHLPSKSTSFSLTTSDFPSLLFPINIQSYYYFSYFWRKTLGPSFPSSYHSISLLPFLKKKKKSPLKVPLYSLSPVLYWVHFNQALVFLKVLEQYHQWLPCCKTIASSSFFFFKFYFIFKLYIIVLVLPNIKMNPPQVYMCSPSWKYSLITHHNRWVFLLPHQLLLLSLLVLQLVHLYFGALQGTLSLLFL